MHPTTAGTRSFLDPERIVTYFGLEKGDHVADFGAGHGYLAIPMARAVGGDGKIYAIDIQKEVLEIIRAKAKTEHLLNIVLVQANLDTPRGSKLKDAFLDFALLANILFQSENKPALFKEAYRVLRGGGRMAVIEWDETAHSLGPPPNLRVKKEKVIELARGAGFELDHEFEAGSHHYGLLFKK